MNVIVKETNNATLEQVRKYAEELVGSYATARLILDLADNIEVLTKERDAAIDKCDKLEDHIVELTSEEHSIPELRNQLQNEFEEKRKCYFAISQLQKASTNLIKERDELATAAKLALRTLDQGGMLNRVQTITVLNQAGVQ